jgi:hypothetical protein
MQEKVAQVVQVKGTVPVMGQVPAMGQVPVTDRVTAMDQVPVMDRVTVEVIPVVLNEKRLRCCSIPELRWPVLTCRYHM